MKLFVYEHITSGALIGETLPSSLADEGDAMLTAIVHDLSEFVDLQVLVMRDFRLDKLTNLTQQVQCNQVDNKDQYKQLWHACLNQADHVFVIAPETDHILSKLHTAIISSNKSFLGCNQTTIDLCSDKYKCFERLKTFNINTPVTQMATQLVLNIDSFNTNNIIIKPIDGAGCINTQLFHNKKDALSFLNTLDETSLAKLIVQPYIEGIAASMSLFINHDSVSILSLNRQYFEHQQSHLVFSGCCVADLSQQALSKDKAMALSKNIIQAIPGLWGFIGIDLVLTKTDPIVIEINPRLTTSYIGLKDKLDYNPASLLIDSLTTKLIQAVTL